MVLEINLHFKIGQPLGFGKLQNHFEKEIHSVFHPSYWRCKLQAMKVNVQIQAVPAPNLFFMKYEPSLEEHNTP